MVDVINFVCLHHLEESAHAQADQFSITMEKRVKVDKCISNLVSLVSPRNDV